MLMRAREESCFFEPIFASTSGSSINEEEAARIGKKLVEEKLIACVNIIRDVRSIYREGEKISDESDERA